MIPVSNVEITYLCDGVAKEFPFPYEYYDKSHVVGFVIDADGVTSKIITNFTFNEVSKKFIYPVEGTALTSGNKIKLRRITELSQTLDLPNEYPFGNIEKAQDKLTMIMQELSYIGVTSIPEVEQSLIDKLNTVIINTNTVKEYEAYALQHRNDAETFKNNASSSASNALTSANNAKTSEDNAKVSETNSKLSETNSKLSETNVTNTINQAVADAVSATTAIANNAKLSEDKAKASELNAKTSENNAKTSELNAQNYATESNSVIGLENHIAKGLKITGTNGFNVDISSGVIVANEIRKAISSQTKTLDPIKTALLYADTNGNIDKVNAQYPIDMIDNNTVGFWIFNKTAAGANVPNSAVGLSSIAVANDLVPSGGITSVDGWCDYASKLDGTSGYYVSQNSTGIPIGANVREFSIMFTVNAINGTYNHLLNMGAFSGTAGFTLNYSSTGALVLHNGSTEYSTGFTIELGKTYKITVKLTGTTISVYINGVLINTSAFAVNTTSTNLYVGRLITGSYFCGVTLHYLEVRNALRTDQATAKIANKLLLPCFYTDIDGSRKNITEILPANSVSLGMVKANSTGVTAYNDTDYMYGRREGAYGGNRRVFLGWKAFSGGTTLTWDNPFGTRKVKLQAVWSQDANGRNECDVASYFISSTDYGVYTGSYTSPSKRIVITTASSGVGVFNGAWQTSGYIGVYATVLE